MHVHSQTQAALSADIVERIIALDALLGHCDEQDRAELAERITALDPSEVTNILAIFGVKSAHIAPVDVAVSDAGAEEASQSHV